MFELCKRTIGNPCHPPLIFLHGFLGSKEDWEPMISYFSDRVFCIAFYLPGHGESPYIEQILASVKRSIHANVNTKPICIGYSLGGRIAMQLRDEFSAIVFLSAHPGLESQTEKETRYIIDTLWSEQLLYLPFEDFLAKWYAQPVFKNTNSVFMIERRLNQKYQPKSLAKVLLQLSLSKQARSLDFPCPVLFLYGENDAVYASIYSKLPKSLPTLPIPNGGHAIHLENPLSCFQHINDWLIT